MQKLWKPTLLLATVGVMIIGMLGSGAWFTDTAVSNPGSITTGTLSIADGMLSTTTLPTITNMAPGDTTGDMVIIIENNGNLDLGWIGDLVVEGPPALKDAIYVDFGRMDFLTPSGAGSWIDDPQPVGAYDFDNFINNGVGTGPYPSCYNAMTVGTLSNKVALSKFDGTNCMGSMPYEFMGALKPNYAYKLTLRFGFAEAAGNAYQNLGPMTLKFEVRATQLKTGALEGLMTGLSAHLDWMNAQILDQTE